MSRRATRSSCTDVNRRFRRSTVTYLVWTPRHSKKHGRRDSHDLAVVGFNQLPTALVDEPMMPMTEQNLILDFSAAAVQPVHYVVRIAP
jgi:hypothetical protein